MKKLPINISHFKTMIEENYIYVDKTNIIYQLLNNYRLLFLSRPRRFGKSLLISTLKELFSANKQLFKDTWIYKSDYKWIEYPIIQLDFSELSFETSEEFKISLSRNLEVIGDNYNIDLSTEPLLNLKFQKLIRELSKKNKVVILIDEYDYALLKNLENKKIAQSIQKIMMSIFSLIKSADAQGYVKALFITGVTKFSRTSIFSGLNNLYDLTLAPEAGLLLGYTQQEIETYFFEYVERFAKTENTKFENILQSIKEWYNGYRFSDEDSKVYNPFSVIYSLNTKKFENYWLETGTPSFLVELLKKQYYELNDLEKFELSSEYLGTFEVDDLPLIAILFQTGYLTIADYDKKTNKYKLGYPNLEVQDAFKRYIIAALTNSNSRNVEKAISQFKEALKTNNIEYFCIVMKSLLANIPYQLHINNEAYYHSLFHFILDLLGFAGQSEISTSKGRIDLVIETNSHIFIFEIKLNSTGQKAIEQIIDKKYYEKYLRFKKPITLIGLSFNIKGKELILDWVKQDL